ncbi:beta-N-acetylhexosaminidase family protein [Sphingobacterium sp. UBA6320]|uniref:beta-N-acetylhexosaminidase family protein n=1 Tax=Sphingobacterium sp. UBA6320 TaxID=1947510 RepID=UPI0025E8AA5F|nr:beta-N-acetylglucosaminidase domain-containing protein [Sphingobacterium sp. UBA6320]
MLSRFLILCFVICTLFATSRAQHIYPIPQKTILKKEHIPYAGIVLKGNIDQQISSILTPYWAKSGIPVRFKMSKTVTNQEGYDLSIGPKSIEVTYKTQRGAFYAAQSLKQLLDTAKQTSFLQEQLIHDFPDVAFRGTVEGFYGEPWSFEDRIAQLKFYGQWKMNTYLYGPKDDPYHSSPNWREPYPQEEAKRIQELVQVAKDNEVDFYWAIHPGKDIKWNKADSLAVLHKFDLMYDLGVRHFAVFFDDISGEGTKAEKQAGLLNYLQKEFVDKKQHVGALIMCPTEYNKLWSNLKPNTYLDLLGDQLDNKIEIMWTGNSVIHDITKEGQVWVNNRIKRPSFVWWNFPVSDYVRNHLLLGPVYGLSHDIKSDMSGFVTNPMDKAEASKVAIFSVADYSWNLKSFDSNTSWLRGIHEVMPEIETSYALFSKHNTDPGPSYHQYRRIESEGFGPLIDSLLHVTPKFKTFPIALKSDHYILLQAEFSKFAPAVQHIVERSRNQKLVSELKPWLFHFASLGQASLSLLDLLTSKDDQEAYRHFLELQTQRNKLVDIDRNNNRNPYQPGIVTGSRHILPWVEKSYFHFAQLFREKGFAVPQSIDQASGHVITSLAPLKALPILNDVITGNRPQQILKLSPMLEVVKLNPKDNIGLEVTSSQFIKDVLFEVLPKQELLKLEFSDDGETWSATKTSKSKAARLINSSDHIVEIKIHKFELVLQ